MRLSVNRVVVVGRANPGFNKMSIASFIDRDIHAPRDTRSIEFAAGVRSRRSRISRLRNMVMLYSLPRKLNVTWKPGKVVSDGRFVEMLNPYHQTTESKG